MRASHYRGLSLRSTGSRRAGSVIVAHGPSCSTACGIFPDQGSNPCPPALAGRFSTTAPPGKPPVCMFLCGHTFSVVPVFSHFESEILYQTFTFGQSDWWKMLASCFSVYFLIMSWTSFHIYIFICRNDLFISISLLVCSFLVMHTTCLYNKEIGILCRSFTDILSSLLFVFWFFHVEI